MNGERERETFYVLFFFAIGRHRPNATRNEISTEKKKTILIDIE